MQILMFRCLMRVLDTLIEQYEAWLYEYNKSVVHIDKQCYRDIVDVKAHFKIAKSLMVDIIEKPEFHDRSPQR